MKRAEKRKLAAGLAQEFSCSFSLAFKAVDEDRWARAAALARASDDKATAFIAAVNALVTPKVVRRKGAVNG